MSAPNPPFDELAEENAALLEQQKILKKRYEQLASEFALSKKREQEQAQQIQRLQIENRESTEEIRSLEEQFAALRSKIQESQEVVKNVSDENKKQESTLEEKNILFLKLENEISSIKETLTKGLSETKNVEDRYLEVVNEKAILYNKSVQYEDLLERRQNEISTLREQLESLSTKGIAGFQQKITDLESRLQKYQDLLRLKEQQIDENNVQISQLLQEKHKLEENLSNVTRYQEEQETRIKVAQQHLAKKVKEAALLQEKIEEVKVQNSDLHGIVNQLKAKVNEAQTSFEQQLLQEKKLHDQLYENARFAESQVSKWEEKYVKAFEKLKILEEKQQQMQGLFTSLGNVIGTQPTSQPTISHSLPSEPKIVEKIAETSSPPKENGSLKQASLFDREQHYSPHRQNLFD